MTVNYEIRMSKIVAVQVPDDPARDVDRFKVLLGGGHTIKVRATPARQIVAAIRIANGLWLYDQGS